MEQKLLGGSISEVKMVEGEKESEERGMEE